jgi:SAM-dependent methyltransferase
MQNSGSTAPAKPATDGSPTDAALHEMLKINKAQQEYYEHADGAAESEVNGWATNLWRRWRGRALSVFDENSMNAALAERHADWLGRNVADAKVLDLGVGYGNPLSLMFAREAREYIAIDLSHALVERFQRQLQRVPTRNARAEVADILSDSFPERDFDIVYARAVFHHFRHFEAFLENLRGRMKPGGIVITLDDPLETWLPMKMLRLAYRPFQTDASWEYPFNSESLAAIQKHFKVEKVVGTWDKSKWAIPLGFIAPDFAKRRASRWNEEDMQRTYDLRSVRTALRASMLLRA